MLHLVLSALARLPLAWLHALGVGLGWATYALSRRYAGRLNTNLKQSGLSTSDVQFRRLRRAAIAETGKGFVELVAIWLKPAAEVSGFVREVLNLEAFEDARRAGRGILILTPHLGCFEIVGFFFGQMLPFTVLYRPPRLRWLEPLLIRGRRRGQVELATTDIPGVRRLLKALRAGRAVGMLPDQAPRFGESVWAPFFNRPALTMTLPNRLRRATGCASFMVFAERLPRGAGYRLHVTSLPDAVGDETELNQAIESMIRMCPEQYLWGYERYKGPRTAEPAVSEATANSERDRAYKKWSG